MLFVTGSVTRYARSFAKTLISFTLLVSSCFGEDVSNSNQPAPVHESIDLSVLPASPPEIAQLIESAKVKFVTGPRRDALRLGRLHSPTLRDGRPVAGVTEYRFGYHFRSEHRWQTSPSSNSKKKLLIINVQYPELEVNCDHTIWLAEQPQAEGFWNDRVLLHELDHVRLSSDPMLAKRFAEKVREKTVFTIELDADAVLKSEQINDIVDRHVRECFDQIADLISVRYKELDRMTDHGIVPFPNRLSLESIGFSTEASSNQ